MRRPTLRRLTATTLTAAVLAVGALAGSAGADAPAGGSDSKLCKALAKIGRLDAQFQEELSGLLDDSTTWDDARTELRRLSPKLNKAWDTVERRIPDRLGDQATTVADFTERTLAALAGAESLEEANDLILDDPDAISAGIASLELDRFSRKTCDVSINNEG